MNDLHRLTDTELQVRIDACRSNLLREWQRGRPGHTIDIYDLARAFVESEYRGLPVKGHILPGQLTCLS